MSQTTILIAGLRAWGDKMSLETISDEALVEALRVFVCNQEIELARICTRELMMRRRKGNNESKSN
jgi:hypothetical protein